MLIDGHWKALRLKSLSATIQLYDLSHDLAEKYDIAKENPAMVARATAILSSAHVPNEYWKLTAPPEAAP